MIWSLSAGVRRGLALAGLAGLGWIAALVATHDVAVAERAPLHVLAYSTFVNPWGPGPELARCYELAFGTRVELLDGGDAGLLASKLRAVSADVVLGFDQLSLEQARSVTQWRRIGPSADQFLAFDRSPIVFVYRAGDIEPPTSLDDLALPRFTRGLAWPDPRVSSVGLQLLLWVLDAKGVDEGFAWIAQLAPNLLSTPASWSAAYGLFQAGQAKLGLGYLASPVYHAQNPSSLNGRQSTFRAAIFANGHPEQIEYAGVPAACVRCEEAQRFVEWLREGPQQRLIVAKNFMLPAEPGSAAAHVATEGSAYAELPHVHVIRLATLPALLKRKDELVARWARAGL